MIALRGRDRTSASFRLTPAFSLVHSILFTRALQGQRARPNSDEESRPSYVMALLAAAPSMACSSSAVQSEAAGAPDGSVESAREKFEMRRFFDGEKATRV